MSILKYLGKLNKEVKLIAGIQLKTRHLTPTNIETFMTKQECASAGLDVDDYLTYYNDSIYGRMQTKDISLTQGKGVSLAYIMNRGVPCPSLPILDELLISTKFLTASSTLPGSMNASVDTYMQYGFVLGVLEDGVPQVGNGPCLGILGRYDGITPYYRWYLSEHPADPENPLLYVTNFNYKDFAATFESKRANVNFALSRSAYLSPTVYYRTIPALDDVLDSTAKEESYVAAGSNCDNWFDDVYDWDYIWFPYFKLTVKNNSSTTAYNINGFVFRLMSMGLYI